MLIPTVEAAHSSHSVSWYTLRVFLLSSICHFVVEWGDNVFLKRKKNHGNEKNNRLDIFCLGNFVFFFEKICLFWTWLIRLNWRNFRNNQFLIFFLLFRTCFSFAQKILFSITMHIEIYISLINISVWLERWLHSCQTRAIKLHYMT